MLFSLKALSYSMSNVLKALFFTVILVASTSIVPYTFAQNNASYVSPLKQLKNGILPEDVVCSEGLTLIKRTTEDSVACVRPQTAQKLVERGWGVIVTNVTKERQALQTSGMNSLYVTRIGPLSFIPSFVKDLSLVNISNQTLDRLPTVQYAINAADRAYDQYKEQCNSSQGCPVTSGTVSPPTIFTGINWTETKIAIENLNLVKVNSSNPALVDYAGNVGYYGKSYSIIITITS